MAAEPASPFDLRWPRHTPRTTLRSVTLDDVEAMWAYRRLPHVCRQLPHGPLSRAEVTARIRQRLPRANQEPNEPETCGVAVLVEGIMVGDAMLRVEGNELWIGYALHPSVWDQGIASEVATELVAIGETLGMAIYADVFIDNPASERVLQRAGLSLRGETERNGHRMLLYSKPAPT